MNKINIVSKIVLLALIAATACTNSLSAWAYYGAVLHDPKTGHIVRLLGDRHAAHSSDEKNEKIFMKNAHSAVDRYLQTKAPEIFLVEAGEAGGMDTDTCMDILSKLELKLPIPLIHRLVWSALKIKMDYKNRLYRDEFPLCENPAISLIAFDLRRHLTNVIDILSESMLSLHALASKASITKILLEEVSLSIVKRSHIKLKTVIDQMLACLDNQFEIAVDCDYDVTFKKMMNEFATSFCNKMFPVDYNRIEFLDYLLESKFDGTNSSETSDNFLKIMLLDYLSILFEEHDLFSKNLGDLGFLSTIGKSRLLKQNITLYTGGNHSIGIAKELAKVGYETLWKQENPIDDPLSKQDCETFFTIKPIKTVPLKSKL